MADTSPWSTWNKNRSSGWSSGRPGSNAGWHSWDSWDKGGQGRSGGWERSWRSGWESAGAPAWDERDQHAENMPAKQQGEREEAAQCASAEQASRPPAARKEQVYDEQFFREYNNFTGNYQQHNAALKYFREVTEDKERPFLTAPRAVTEEVEICAVRHAKGMDFEVDWRSKIRWSWLEMVAQLNDESISVVVRGEDGRSCGLVACSFSPRPNSYDHKRHHLLKTKGETSAPKLPIWDFVLHRDDGTAIRLHPQWSNTKVETFNVEGHVDEMQPPAAGLGRSDGPGTYKRFKDTGNSRTMRFDATKNKRPPKHAVKPQEGKASSSSS